MNVTVIGAGIGGLTTALSLHAAGIDVRVYESVAEMKAIGFGINLQPNAARELIELGLGEALAETAIETAQLGYYNKLGQLIWSEPRGRGAGYAWPQYAIERGDLQMILLDAVKARIGADNILTGHHLISFEQDGWPRISSTGEADGDFRRRAATRWWAATAFIPPCGRSSIRASVRR